MVETTFPKLKKLLAKINKSSKGVKARTRMLSNGSVTIYLDIHGSNGRCYEQTALRLSCLPDFLEEDKRTLDALGHTLLSKESQAQEARYKKQTDGSTDVYVLDWFEDYVKNRATNTTYATATFHLTKFLELQKNTKIVFSELDYDFCLKFADYIKSIKLKTNTKYTYFAVFNIMLNRAEEESLILKNPAKRIRFYTEDSNPEYLTQDEIITLLKTPAASCIETKNAFIFSCFTGLRVSDIYKLRFSMIRDNVLSIRQKKTGAYVRIPITDDMNDMLKVQREKHTDDVVFHMPDKRMMAIYLKQWFKDAGLLVNGRKLSFHSGRHSCGMRLLENNISLPSISVILGHRSIKSTVGYLTLKDKKLAQDMNSVPSIIKANS